MKNFLINQLCRIKGKSREQLNLEFLFYYFVTRSMAKSWFMVIRNDKGDK